jgi:hypothetical protein
VPDPLPTDAVQLEKTIRGLVAAELIASGAENFPEGLRPLVYDRPRWIESEPEWLKLAAIRHPQNMQQGGMETRVVFLSFDDFSEVDEGACGHTQLTLVYEVEVLFGLVDRRKDGSNSHDDFVAYVMRARQHFKENRTFGYARNQLEHQLLQTEEKAQVKKIDFATVHRIILSLAVVVG